MNQKFRHLYILFLAETIERFTFWGIQSILILYLIKGELFTTSHATAIYGTFASLSFALAILSGFVADRFIGFRRIQLTGMFIACMGCILLAIPSSHLILAGLGLVICGSGFFMPNNASLLGSFYSKFDQTRERGFTIFYIGTNLGGIAGPIIYGFSALFGWHWPFILSAVSMILWFFLYIFNYQYFKNNGLPPRTLPIGKHTPLLFVCFVALIVLMVLFLTQHAQWMDGILSGIALAALTAISWVAFSHKTLERNRIFLLVLLIMVALFFFACAFQIYTSLVIFIEQHVRHTLCGFTIPASAFASLEPFFVIVSAPLAISVWKLLNKKLLEPTLLTKFTIGLGLAGASFIIFAMAAHAVSISGNPASVLWIFTGNFLLACGEICIMPPLISAVTLLSPGRLNGTMMGLFYLSLAFSGYLASIIAKLTVGMHPMQVVNSVNIYSDVYLKIATLAIGIALCLFLLSNAINYFAPDFLKISKP